MKVSPYLAILCLALFSWQESTEARYVIVAGGKVLPNSDYYVTATLTGAEKPTNLTVSLIGELANNQTLKRETSSIFNGNETKVLVLQTGALEDGKYQISAAGSGGFNFNKSATVHLEKENVLTFTQTDKKTYKPGQVIKFRSVIVNQDLVPLEGRDVVTKIMDAERNILKVFTDRTPKTGIVGHEFKLSDQPVLGKWVVESTVGKTTYKKDVVIEEYLLPTFDVSITLPPFVTVNTTSFPISVKADYTYGKPVKGRLNLTIFESHHSYHHSESDKRVEFRTDIAGETTVMIATTDFVKLQEVYYTREYDVVASVVESLSKKTYNATKQLKIHKNLYRFKMLDPQRDYIEGVDFVLTLKIETPDEAPIPNSDKKVKLYYRVDEVDKEAIATVNNGVAKFILNTKSESKKPIKVTTLNGLEKLVYPFPKSSYGSIRVEAEYDGFRDSVGYLYKSNSNCSMQMEQLSGPHGKKYRVGDLLELALKFSGPLPELIYYVVSRKGLVKSQTIPSNGNHTRTLKLRVQPNMTPTFRVVIQYFCGTSYEVETLDVDVEDLGRTNVSVSYSANQVTPGSNVTLTVKSDPNSTVCLLAIDQRMSLLRQGNDIEPSHLDEGIKKFLGCNGDTYFGSCSYQGSYYWDPDRGSSSLRSAGLVVLSDTAPSRIVDMDRDKTDAIVEEAYEDDIAVEKNEEPIRSTTARPFAATSRPARPPSSTVSAPSKMPSVKIRKEFPETWIWSIIDVNDTGSFSMTEKVPDSITSWVTSSFVVNPVTGLGIMRTKPLLNVFNPFFVKLNLPYSVIRGETIAIEVIVYNYMQTSTSTAVTLQGQGKDFDFLVAGDEENDVASNEDFRTKDIVVPADDGAKVSFLITPKKVGFITIDVKAEGSMKADRVIHKLLVKPEGDIQRLNKAFLVNLNATTSQTSEVVKIDIPEEAVQDSERTEVSIIGDVLGPAINNIDSLLRMPYGCGEQNMINFVPNILVLRYLGNLKRLTPQTQDKALSHIEVGYQRELSYRHRDGSYSAFGRSDKKGSTWLTAFVLKSFLQAKPFFAIDEKVIKSAVTFLLAKQRADGSFEEQGYVLSPSMQSGTSGKSAALTAYVLIALSQTPSVKTQNSSSIEKAERFLQEVLTSSKDNYEIAIAAYALHLTNATGKDAAYEKLVSSAIRKDNYLFWSSSLGKQFNEASVEMTAYGIMTLLLRNEIEGALPAVKWLISKQNANGGFSSTQDTVIGLEALESFAAKLGGAAPNLKVKVEAGSGEPHEIIIDGSNSIVLQNIVLPSRSKTVKITASGSGTAIIQTSWQYNIKRAPVQAAYTIISEKVTDDRLRVCTRSEGKPETTMVVMEVATPSGYVVDLEQLYKEVKNDVKRAETADANTKAIFYFEGMGTNNTCVHVSMDRVAKVAKQQPASIRVYSYYNVAMEATATYKLKELNSCDICEGSDCGKSCKAS